MRYLRGLLATFQHNLLSWDLTLWQLGAQIPLFRLCDAQSRSRISPWDSLATCFVRIFSGHNLLPSDQRRLSLGIHTTSRVVLHRPATEEAVEHHFFWLTYSG